MQKFRHSYLIISANFDLEPVLKDYLIRYPDGDYSEYRIVFTVKGEHFEGNHSYIVILTLNKIGRKQVSFDEFLDAYCKLNNVQAFGNQVGSIFPNIQDVGKRGSIGNLYGKLPGVK